MLTEIFESVRNEIDSYLKTKNIKKVRIRIGKDGSSTKTTIRIELVRFGVDLQHANFVQGTVSDKIYYAFTFFITVDGSDYTEKLELIEHIAGYAEKKPFLQLKISEKEFESGISPLELSIADINQFWLAQKQKHQPVLFYQARISEV